VLDKLAGFDWDVHNVGHIWRHGVLPDEVEQTVGRRHVLIAAAPHQREKRWKLFGITEEGRYLVVVFTIRRGRFRTVTAYAMNRSERRMYGSQL
jgi:hypothetical protein